MALCFRPPFSQDTLASSVSLLNGGVKRKKVSKFKMNLLSIEEIIVQSYEGFCQLTDRQYISSPLSSQVSGKEISIFYLH